jgi:hypothetical protein
MKSAMIKFLLVAAVSAQVKYQFDDDEILLNRAQPDLTVAKFEHEIVSNYFKTYKMMHKFIN